ncbi:MAG: 2,3-bisphosphoglycerate-independent phosphoglycerate mutase, partial [bacterium]
MKRPLVLIIRDGWGIGNPDDPGNAVAAADTPVTDRLLESYPHCRLGVAGEDVGLTPGSQGSSEVGHLNMGAGRIVEQEVVRVNKRIDDGSFFSDPALLGAIENCKANDSSLHLMGLVQDQGVHAMDTHLYALLELARRHELKRVFVHFFSDGRDTPPRSALTYLERLETKMAELGVGRIASVMGRYYAMDRDRNWDRIRLAYEALTEGKGLKAGSAREAIEQAYARADEAIARAPGGNPDEVVETDEFIRPTVIVEGPEAGGDPDKGDFSGKPFGVIRPGDSVIFFNYRQDRAVELSMAFVEDEFDMPGFRRGPKIDLHYLGLTRYYDAFENYVIPPMDMNNILSEVLAANRLWQLRISETQKFRHVTSFFNSKMEEPCPGEERILIASPKVPEETKPEMSAYEVTDMVLKAVTGGIAAARDAARKTAGVTLYEAPPLEPAGGPEAERAGNSAADRLRDTYDLIVINFVNGDMVGHTGVFEAGVKAIET